VDYQLFPRLLAIAERGWSPKGVRDKKHFRQRVRGHLTYLDEMGVEYNRSAPVLMPVKEPILTNERGR
jgi:hexosaminidase